MYTSVHFRKLRLRAARLGSSFVVHSTVVLYTEEHERTNDPHVESARQNKVMSQILIKKRPALTKKQMTDT